MEVSKYISIPQAQQRVRSKKPLYLKLTQLLISLLTGILIICFNTINNFTIVQSELEVIYLFSAIILAKSIIPINYILKSKKIKSRLQQNARVDIGGLFIPSFLKSLLYFGYMMFLLYLQSALMILLGSIAVISVQLLEFSLKRKAKKQIVIGTTKNYQQLKKIERKSNKLQVNIKQIFVEVLIVIAVIFQVQQFSFTHQLQTVIVICLVGVCSLLAFFYLHHQILELYHCQVDEILAKEYPIEVINFFLFAFFFWSLGYTESILESNTISKIGNQTNTPVKFLFVLEYPVHTFMGVCLSILYEYLVMEMIKKSSFKLLFLTQMTGIFWTNLYLLIKEGLSERKYFSTFISSIALVMLTSLIDFERLGSKVAKLMRWGRIKSQKKNNNKSMVQEEQIK